MSIRAQCDICHVGEEAGIVKWRCNYAGAMEKPGAIAGVR